MSLPPIISVDDHVMEPPDLFQRWLPSRYAAAAPHVRRVPWERGPGYRQDIRVATSGDLADCWFFGDIPQFVLRQVVAIGLDSESIDIAPASYADMRPGFCYAKERLADMDVVKVERSLCFPNASRFGGQMFLWMDDRELAAACVRAYNDWMVEEWCGDSGGRLLPLCLVPLWDPVLAAAEVRRNAERGVRAVTFSELPPALGLPSIHAADGHWIPFIEACDETSTVICLHIGSSSTIPRTSDDAPLAVAMSATSFNAQLAFSDWLLSGHLARYSNLKIAFSESQIGWIPFVTERIDRIWRNGNAMSGMRPEIVDLPSSYVPGRVYGCFFEDDFGVASREAVGIDSITFESDYPHQDSTWPDTHSYLEHVLADVPAEDAYKIARGNALRMLGLPDELLESAAHLAD